MFEQTFKNIDDILFKDSGADSELDYIGQTSWIMFLRYLDELEISKADEAELEGKEYTYILKEEYSWNTWAMPKDENGNIDHHKALTGIDLVQFVDMKLFPYLASFKQTADHAQTIEYKIGEIFSELKNKIQEEAFNGPLAELQVVLTVPWFLTLLLTVFLSFSEISIWIKMLSLTAATAMFAPLLGIILINMDENDGLRMIKLTVLLTFVTAIVGMYSGIDFSALGYILIIPLGILVTWNFLSIFYNFSSFIENASTKFMRKFWHYCFPNF